VAGLIARSSPALRRRDVENLTAPMQQISGRDAETWGTIIGFGRCEYRYPTGRMGTMGLLSFAPRKAATTIYLMDGARAEAGGSEGQLGRSRVTHDSLRQANASVTPVACRMCSWNIPRIRSASPSC